MKNGLKILPYGIMIWCIAILCLACSSDSDDNQNNNNMQEIAEIVDDMQSGTWRITNYIDSGDNETNDFNGYTFTFGSDNTLVATNGTITYNGTWSVTDDSNSSDDDIDFNIFFPVSDDNDFEDLNDDWDIIEHSASTISLRDVSGGDGSIDTLIFEKN